MHRLDRASRDAGVAHLVERHLAKVEVASSSLVTCSNFSSARKGHDLPQAIKGERTRCLHLKNAVCRIFCKTGGTAFPTKASFCGVMKRVRASSPAPQKITGASTLLLLSNIWRHSQVVRQRSAKPLPPVRVWVAPPKIDKHRQGLVDFYLFTFHYSLFTKSRVSIFGK